MNLRDDDLPVAVIGTGPVGLAATAHLVQHGLKPVVLEASSAVAANLQSYRHVRLFSPWRNNLDHVATALLSRTDWREPNLDDLPTAGELIDDYLLPLVKLPSIFACLRLNSKVVSITREGFDKAKSAFRDRAPFLIQMVTPRGRQYIRARAVLDATGNWSHPNPLGANGVPAIGEIELSPHIIYGMPDILGKHRPRYEGKHVLVAGAGHSAAGNLVALAELAKQSSATKVYWAHRGCSIRKGYGGAGLSQLPARSRMTALINEIQGSGCVETYLGFGVWELRKRPDGIQVSSDPNSNDVRYINGIDEIIVATGSRPGLQITRELRLSLDPSLECAANLAALIDPNIHRCGTIAQHGHRELSHPESGYYTIGAKSYGRAPGFLLMTGYEQVRSVVAALVEDLAGPDHAVPGISKNELAFHAINSSSQTY